MNRGHVYMMSNKKNGTLYVGVTGDLMRRVYEHKNDLAEGFTKKYGLHTLVYAEEHQMMSGAIDRESQLKNWQRRWKIELIEKTNPEWKDLYETML